MLADKMFYLKLLFIGLLATPLGCKGGNSGDSSGADDSSDPDDSSNTDNSDNAYDGALSQDLVSYDMLSYPARTVAFSPDGTTVAIGEQAYAVEPIHFFNAETGEELGVINGMDDNWEPTAHLDWVIGMVYSPDGTKMATSCRDGSVMIWDVETGEVRHTIDEYFQVSWVEAISPDGKTLYTTGTDGQTYFDAATDEDGDPLMWSMETGEITGKLDEVSTCGFRVSPDNASLVGCRAGGEIIWIDLNSGEITSTLTVGSEDVQTVLFSADGTRLAALFANKKTAMWDLDTGAEVSTFTDSFSGDDFYRNPQLNNDGSRLVATVPDIGIIVIDTNAGDGRVLVESTDDIFPTQATMSTDGKTLVAGFNDGHLELWDMATETKTKQFDAHTENVTKLALSPYSNAMVTSSNWDATTRLWAE